MQNVTTNNVSAFVDDAKLIAQSSAVLDPKGRIITDLRIVKPVTVAGGNPKSATDQLWLLLRQSALKPLKSHFSKYAFKKKLAIQDISSNFDILNYTVR